jgi:branched-chain amino acid transport system permease protein
LAGVLNLAHGQVAVLGAIVVSLLMEDGMSVAAAVAVGIVGASAFMVFLDLTLMRAVYHQEGERRILLGLLLMLGVSFAIDGFVTWRYPVQQLRIRVEGDAVVIVGVPMPVGALLASAIAIAIGLLLVGFFRLTTLGRGVRSVIQDEAGARLCGVNPSAVRTLVFGMSGALACLVAVTRSMTGPIGFSNAIGFTTLALIVAVVGGLGSVSGAFLAGVLLGVVDRLSSTYIGTYVTTIALLVCAALTIVLRPSGLLGRPE